MAGERASKTTQLQWQATTNGTKSMRQMMRAATERARAARVMVRMMRVVGNKEGKGSKGNGVGDEGGVQGRG